MNNGKKMSTLIKLSPNISMIQVRQLRKISTYPYRYVRLSRQLVAKKPHKIRTNIKNVTLRCAPGIISEIMNETVLSTIKTSTTEIVEHYIIGICLNAIISTFIYSTLETFSNNDNNESN